MMSIKGTCEECGRIGIVNVHHIDGYHNHDAPENRRTLCPHCHRQAHIELCLKMFGRPGAKAASTERLPLGWHPEPLPWAEVRRQYFACFPRA